MTVRISALRDEFDISHFNCGVRGIDEWIRKDAKRTVERNRANVFCAHLADNSTPLGVYTLSLSFENSKALAQEERALYKTGNFPAVYIDYIAVLRSCQCQGLGKIMLMNALSRAYYVSQHVPFYGVALRSLNDRTTSLYKKYGFAIREYSGNPPLMILPIWTLRDLMRSR